MKLLKSSALEPCVNHPSVLYRSAGKHSVSWVRLELKDLTEILQYFRRAQSHQCSSGGLQCSIQMNWWWSLLMALNSGHISNHKRTSRDIYNINDLQIGYWRTTILVMIHHWWTQNQAQFSNVQSFLSSSDTRLSLSLKTWSTGMPLYHISQISTLSIVVICMTMIYRSQSQWGGSWEDLLLYCLLAEQDLQHCWP